MTTETPKEKALRELEEMFKDIPDPKPGDFMTIAQAGRAWFAAFKKRLDRSSESR